MGDSGAVVPNATITADGTELSSVTNEQGMSGKTSSVVIPLQMMVNVSSNIVPTENEQVN